MHTQYAIIGLIAFAFVGLVALTSQGIFERIPHVEDEAAYWFQAQVFARGRLAVPTPPYPHSYWSPFVIDYNGWRFAKYPPGYPLLLSLGMLIEAPWAVNAVLGALALVLVADLGRRIYPNATGVLAGVLGLTCPALLVTASTLLSHTAAIFWATLFLWSFAGVWKVCCACVRPGRVNILWYPAILSGIALGFLFLTRPYDAVGVGLPFVLYAMLQLVRSRRCEWLVALGILAIIGGVIAALLPVYWYLLSGRWFYNPYLAVFPYDRPGFGADVGNGGYTLTNAWFNLRYNLGRMITGFLGWPGYANVIPMLVPAFAILGRALPRGMLFSKARSVSRDISSQRVSTPEAWDVLLLATFLCVVAVYTTYWFYGGHDGGFPRYWLAALPALLLLTARGLSLISQNIMRISRQFFARPLASLPVTALYLVVIALVSYNAFVFLPPELTVFRGRYGITAEPLEIVQQADVHHALVFVKDVQHWTDFAVFFAATSPMFDSDVVYAIYHDHAQARAVRGLFSNRACYLYSKGQLLVCSFE